jgi:hypothetical protein
MEANREAMAGLTEAEQALLRQLLERVVVNVERISEEEPKNAEGPPVHAATAGSRP